jgi:hypothetical protein
MTRAPKAVWSDRDTALLQYAVSCYEQRKVNYAAVAKLFADRSVKDVKKRCAVLRDRERRRERWRELQAHMELTETANTPSPEDDGQLHPEVVWVPPEPHELETLF